MKELGPGSGYDTAGAHLVRKHIASAPVIRHLQWTLVLCWARLRKLAGQGCHERRFAGWRNRAGSVQRTNASGTAAACNDPARVELETLQLKATTAPRCSKNGPAC